MTQPQFPGAGIAAEQHRLEVLDEAAGMQLIADARSTRDGTDRRPFAAPGTFLVYLRQHVATGRFRPVTARPAGAVSQ
jgi:hypothetical protein